VITVGRDFLLRFPQYAERAVYLSDGCVEVNRAPALYANEKAREIAPVRMTGNYGSEVLRANRAFKPEEPLSSLFHSELLPYFRKAQVTYANLLRTHPVSFAVFRQAPWYHYGIFAVEQSQIARRSPFLDNDIVRTVFRAPETALVTSDACLRLIADGDPGLRQIRADRGLAGNHGPLTAAMARAFHEFTFKAEYAYDYGMPQWVARIDNFFAPFHPERLFLGRHKFYHFRVWYRDALAAYVREMLLDRRTLSRPYLRRNTVETIVQSHLRGDRNYTTEIHKVLTLELLHQLFLDPGCSLERLAVQDRRAFEPTAVAESRK
jgi:asparagine synthase (glutamine-hydrolysing)